MEEKKRNESLSKDEEFIKKTMEKLMGEVLDMARINGMGSQEQFEQFSEATLQHHQKVAIAILLGSEFSVTRTCLTLGGTPKVYYDIQAFEADRVRQCFNYPGTPERPLGISWRLS